MNRRTICWAGPMLVALLAGPSLALAVQVPAASVSAALVKARGYILSQQVGGNWEGTEQPNYAAQKTGWTALAVNALLAAGANPQDPPVAEAIKFLKANDTDGVYALGQRLQVWQRLPAAPDVRAAAELDTEKLIKGVGLKGDAKGMYGYSVTGGGYSHSRAQYGVLGLATAERMGIPVPDNLWKLEQAAWIGHQLDDGGWTYQKAVDANHPATAGMTSAGVASLMLIQDSLREGDSPDCRPVAPNPSVLRGLDWLGKHADEIADDRQNPRNYPYPTLYGIERVGAAGGIKYFGTVDWYAKGAKWLVDTQLPDGSWPHAGLSSDKFTDSCFATLFLAHGRAPVFMQKLDYSSAIAAGSKSPVDPAKAAAWNRRPWDVANLARRTGAGLEQELAWQIVTLQSPEIDYHDAPILYIAGHDVVKFDDAAKAKLKQFIEDGGMIVANPDCGGQGFAVSIQHLGTELTGYEFRTLPPTHPIFTRQQYVASKWRQKQTLLGLSNGARELMILLPSTDPARAWDAGTYGGKEAVFELGADLYQYVSSRTSLRYRGESHVVLRDPAVAATATIKVGRLQYPGNWNPEPGGWRALAGELHNRAKVDLDVSPVKADADLRPFAVIHATGTEDPQWTDATRAALKAYVDGGGTLIVDSAGGVSTFARPAGESLAKTFGSPPVVIPADDPLFKTGNLPPVAVKYRAFATDQRGRLDVPRLQGIRAGSRWAVIFSPDDLSVGLVGQEVDGILGYTPAVATDLMSRCILSAGAKNN